MEQLRPLVFDTETCRFGQGLMAPPMVCVTWKRRGMPAKIRHAMDAKLLFEDWLKGDELMVGHNVAYDMAVVCATWPDLIPLVFAKYDRDQITDTMIREQLLAIAHGCFRGSIDHNGEWKPTKFALDACYHRRTNVWLSKEDRIRLGYAAYQYVPVEQWPKEFVDYPLSDADAPLLIFDSQEEDRWMEIDGVRRDLLADQFRQARAAFALRLSTCWGVTTDPAAVAELESKLVGEFDVLVAELQQAGIVRADGSADTKAAKAVMVQACIDTGRTPKPTAKGDISLAADWCEEVAGDENEDRTEAQELVAKYSAFLTLRKTISNDVEMLRKGLLHPEYGMAETGRTRAKNPNIQNVTKAGGIRECFRPRPGTTFAQADYESLELHTLAQWCESVMPEHHWPMADALRAGLDLHTMMAAEMLGISYEEGLRRKKLGDKDPEFKDARQAAKALNFGLPGGLGKKRLAAYAWTNYGVRMSEEQAAEMSALWRTKWCMQPFFDRAAQLTSTPDKMGAEMTLFSECWGSGMRYSQLCNRRFQRLGADAAKRALWLVTRACYAEPVSPLYGSRVVAFIHDEIMAEVPLANADAAARELSRLMELGARDFLPDVTPKAPPTLQMAWSKDAKALYDTQGRLVPWSPAGPELAKAA